jgi:hypothetical protein
MTLNPSVSPVGLKNQNIGLHLEEGYIPQLLEESQISKLAEIPILPLEFSVESSELPLR